MKLNWIGRASMNNPLRSLGQRYVSDWMKRLGGTIPKGHALEIGCGGGNGTKIILEKFGAREVDAFDLDPKMIKIARKNISSEGSRVHFSVGNIISLKFKDSTFDAIFDFGAIHLEPNWKKGVAEIARVLKPGGKFFFELVTSRPLRLIYPLLTEDFGQMKPPKAEFFLKELEQCSIHVGKNFTRLRLAALTGWVGDLVGVGELRRKAKT